MTRPDVSRAARLYLRAWGEAGRFHPHILLAIAIGVAFAPIALLLPLPIKIVVDSAIGNGPLPGPLASWLPGVSGDHALLLAVALALGFATLQAAWGYLDRMFREWLSDRMTLEFRSRLFLHGLGLPLANDEKGSFDAIQRIAQDAPALVWTALYGVLPLVTAGATLAGVFAVTASISVELGFLALATAVPAILLTHRRQGRLRSSGTGPGRRRATAWASFMRSMARNARSPPSARSGASSAASSMRGSAPCRPGSM